MMEKTRNITIERWRDEEKKSIFSFVVVVIVVLLTLIYTYIFMIRWKKTDIIFVDKRKKVFSRQNFLIGRF